MKKTMIYIDEVQHERLQRLAGEQRTSLAQLIRRAIAVFLDREGPRPQARFIGQGDGPVGGNASTRIDEVLRELSS